MDVEDEDRRILGSRIESVTDLFTKINALNLHKITKKAGKITKYGRYTGDFPQIPPYDSFSVEPIMCGGGMKVKVVKWCLKK